MPGKGSMPPELLAHFKKKRGENEESDDKGTSNDKERRKDAVKKARIHMEESKRKKKPA